MTPIRTLSKSTLNDISVWWSLKVLCGLLLVANQAAYFAFTFPPPMLRVPIALSQLLVISGAVIFFGHFTILKKANPLLNCPNRLVRNKGLFRWVRHPMYLGEMMLDIGLVSFCLNPLSLAVVGLALFALFKQARHEDRILADRFGLIFSEWKKHTGLLLIPHF